jgi:predicted nucleic acid-binding protein
MDYLIDTDILVDYLRQNPQAIEYLKSVGNWSYSVVTAMELFAGARDNKEVAAVERFLDLYPEVALSEESGTKGREILKKYAKADGLDPLDALIAGSAIRANLRLATKNAKHFRNIDGLSLEIVTYPNEIESSGN